ncbi:class I SAM-dependent methyltransferase [Bradyrhizobium retamae]|uniref:3-demethylubiquinone-9 3-methyltransferase n=1 Tax=Bradyrhizobium retamae TaxID=1300035 RepID=A0A0R3MRI0_9BRAD|nr:class I SAM-dependent methyltransferase [Bradyrhizobium retamae]KRR20349.1 3-demethylubiquinone-9 3-methyltransferase [Bradyrhizobium retamae]
MTEAIEKQRAFWNDWNASTREKSLNEISIEQTEVIVSWLSSLRRRDLKIIEIGCGAGWLCTQLVQFGQVTATDLSDEVLARAAQRVPQARFIAGDFMTTDVGSGYDVAISLEVLAHVADQAAFLSKIAGLLKPGGHLMLATQNKPALVLNDIPAPGPGQLRHWVDRHELHELLAPRFRVKEMFSITPRFNRGVLRILNSYRLQRAADRVFLGSLMRGVKWIVNKMWLGWTIMGLAEVRR